MTANHQVAEANAKYLAGTIGQVVPIGYKQTEVGVIPEDWDCCEIGYFNPFVTSGSRGWASFYAAHGYVFVRITNMSRRSIYLDLTETKFVLLPYQSSEGKRTSLENGDILVSITADIGICSYVDERLEKPAFINQHVALIRFDKKEIHSKFVAYFLSSENVQKLFKGAADQGAKAGMNLDAVRKIRAAIPSKSEQTAIANALSDVDALINELEKLIAKKQAIKTATMQQLLTGRTRLPQFALREDGTQKGYKQSELGEIPEDWEVLKLGQLGKFKNGINKDAASFGYGFPFVNLMDVFGKPTISNKTALGLINSTEFDRKEYGLKEGDILFIRSSVKPTGVGLTTVIKHDLEDTVYSGFLIRYRAGVQLSNEFKEHCFYEESFRNRIIAGSTVSANTNINQDTLKEILLGFPGSIQEQTAIANILSDMDTDIQTLQQRLSKTRQIKQGMMQELLTGKIRLIKPEPSLSANDRKEYAHE